MNILVVDDSVVFRSQIKSALKVCDAFKQIDVAANGKIALTKLEREKYDLTILDLEMPELNGIETLKEIRARNIQTKVIVFSSLTARGAQSTIEALENGATDFVTKPQQLNSFELAFEHIKAQLIPKALQFTGATNASTVAEKAVVNLAPMPTAPKEPPKKWKKILLPHVDPKVCVIGSSTGGPVALKALFSKIKGPLKHPILIAQHMPPVFTKTLAKSIEDQTGIPAQEAKHFEELENKIYVAPGDYHLTIKENDGRLFTSLDKRPKRNSVRPAVDFLFESAAEIFQENVLSMVLTGMGADGAEGACAIKDQNGFVLIQDEETSVVWGMPGAVHGKGAFDQMSSIEECATVLAKKIGSL